MIYKAPKNKINHVYQREDYDCMVACLSMLTGEEYEVIHAMLVQLGWKPSLKMGVSDRLACLLLKKFGEKPVLSFHIHPVPSIVTVPSINQRAKLHAVVYDGEESVLDPLYKKPFKNYYDIDHEIGYCSAKSLTLEKFFESSLSHERPMTVPWDGFVTPKDREMEGIGKRMVKNMLHWDERERPINQNLKWQIEEMDKILVGRGIDVRNECK